MATLGRGKMKKDKRGPLDEQSNIPSPAVNLAITSSGVEPTTTLEVQPSAIGGPIMREDFITSTGIKQS